MLAHILRPPVRRIGEVVRDSETGDKTTEEIGGKGRGDQPHAENDEKLAPIQMERTTQENGQNREGKEDGKGQMILGNAGRVKDMTGVESAQGDHQNERQTQSH